MFRVPPPTSGPTISGVRAAALAFVLAHALAACVYPATEVIVTLDTDAPADRFMTVRAVVHFGDGDAGVERMWERGGGVPGAITLPASFAVVPGRGPLDQTVTLEFFVYIAPSTPGGPPTEFSRRAAFSLNPHHTGALGVFLPYACGATASGCTSVSAPMCTQSVLCTESGLTCGNDANCTAVHTTPSNGQDAGRFRPDATTADADTLDTTDAPIEVRPDVPATDTAPCNGAGVCTPGATRSCMCNGTQTCNGSCAWGSCSTNCPSGQVCGSSGSCCASSCPGRCSYNTCTGAVCNSCPSTARFSSPSNCTMIGSVTTVCNHPENPLHNECDCPGTTVPCCSGGCC